MQGFNTSPLRDFFDGIRFALQVKTDVGRFAYELADAEPVTFQPAKYGKLHTPEQPPSIDQAQHAAERLRLSEDCFSDSGAPAGYRRLDNHRVVFSGMAAATYQNLSTGEIIVAFRGSELGKTDFAADVQLTNGGVPQQIYDALNYLRDVEQAYPGANISLTGISLGGTLASVAALASGRPAVVFNDIGLNPATIGVIEQSLSARGKPSTDWHAHARQIVHFNAKGEYVSDGDRQMDAGTLGRDNHQYGDIFYLDVSDWQPIAFGVAIDQDARPITTHYPLALKRALSSLSNPAYRQDPKDRTAVGSNELIDHPIDSSGDAVDFILGAAMYGQNSQQSIQDETSGQTFISQNRARIGRRN
ncbi:MAG: DUF2974 domain-containing protein [Gammaproteobacteria bacterium]|nr:DUF2974 domain-containing protein [Gammaproteobacteria bacterium]